MGKKLNENLNIAKAEPEGKVKSEAAKKGLKHVGFGRYEDQESGQITHINQNDKLVSFRKAVKTTTFQQQNSDDVGNLLSILSGSTEELHNKLVSAYSPDKYDDDELNAIYSFVEEGYYDINARLASLPTGVSADKIEPMSPDDTTPDLIMSLDSAMKKSRVPMEIMVYTSISSDALDLGALVPGKSFKFKGFRVTSINLDSAIIPNDEPSPLGRNQTVILQITVKKNARGIYASDFSANSEGEFILPRGATIEIISGPEKLVGSDAATNDMNLEILYFDCVTKG